jgi:hypothetical protein
MFCTRCGAQTQPDFMVCLHCGCRLSTPSGPLAQSRLERHLHTLAILWMAIGGLFLLPAAGLMVFGRAARFVVHRQEPLAPFFPLLVYVAGSTLLLLGAGGVCVGLGLLQHRPWARTAAIILAVLALFHPPFGTALGIYTLWVLLAGGHAEQYNYLARST